MILQLGDRSIEIKSFYLNLDRDIERRESSEKMFTHLGIEVERFPAITGEYLKENPHIIKPYISNHLSDWLTWNETACHIGHIMLWEKARKNNWPYLMVFEDDCNTYANKDNFYQHIKNIFTLTPNFDIAYLGQAEVTCKKTQIISPPLYRNLHENSCLHSYIISRKGIEQMMNEMPLEKQIDLAVPQTLTKRKETYVTIPSMFTQKILEVKSNSRGTQYSQAVECRDTNDKFVLVIVIVISILALVAIICFAIYVLYRKCQATCPGK